MGDFVSGVEHTEAANFLADPAWQRVLFALFAEHLFLSAGQAEHLRRRTAPSDTPAELVRGAHTRFVLNSLVDAGLLGSAPAFLPKATIGASPILVRRQFDDEGPPDDRVVARLVAAADGRLEPLNRHAERTLYFAKDGLGPVLRAAGFRVWYWKCDEDWRAREGAVRTLLDWHQEVATRKGSSPREIACTLLAAHYNINQLRLAEAFPEPLPQAKCEFSARWSPGRAGPQARFDGPTFGLTNLFFLRPLPAREIIEQIAIHHGMDGMFMKCWWM
ncbi:MAG: hypothetical protein C0501_29800 [Isosphaera sp.]|nr:hypothetical protein [Isosphaera sp.]